MHADDSSAAASPSSGAPRSVKESSPNPHDQYLREVEDARLLLEFAVATGCSIPDPLILAIKEAADTAREVLPPAQTRSEFEKAYRDLVIVMLPVTADTLRATSDAHGRPARFLGSREPISDAKRWSRKLWIWTVLVAVSIVFSEVLNNLVQDQISAEALPTSTFSRVQTLAYILQALDRFAYGAFGALAYLLRSAHEFIYQRTFNRLRIPEYYNRVLLGMVSGGAIQLFISQIADDEGNVVEISAAAFAFLAGYNSDFLFSTVERISAAVLPKVGIETMRRGTTEVRGSISLEQVLEQYKTATDEDKRVLQPLITKLTERL